MTKARQTLGLFARYPRPGVGKTRLAAQVGVQTAFELYRAFVLDLLERMSARHPTELWLTSDFSVDEAEDWFRREVPREYAVHSQPDGDLGARIDTFFDNATTARAGHPPGDGLRTDFSSAVLIGSDSPDLPDSLIAEAFEELETAQAVFAPAADGGFALVGCRDAVPGLFQGIGWSQSDTLLQVLERCQSLNVAYRILSPWYDVDDVTGLCTLMACLDSNADKPTTLCSRTRSVLNSIHPTVLATRNRAGR